MKTIKDYQKDEDYKDYEGESTRFERGALTALEDVLGLLDERMEEWGVILVNLISLEEDLRYQDELLSKIKAYIELKKRIEG